MEDVFLRDLVALLTRTRKAHMGRHLYSGRGAELWRKLAEEEPSYPISREGARLVESKAYDMARCIEPGGLMVDLAPGAPSSVKVSAHLARTFQVGRYHAIEGSEEFCRAIPHILGPELPGVTITAEARDISAPYESDLVDVPTIVYCGSSTITNLENDIRPEFPFDTLIKALKEFVQYARHGWLILTFDTTHDRVELDKRYRNSRSEDFIIDLMNRAAEYYPALRLARDGFRYDPEYARTSGQYAHVVEATVNHDCSAGLIRRGARFHIVNSYKIEPQRFEDAVKRIKYTVEFKALDENSGVVLYMIRSPRAPLTIRDAEGPQV